MNSYDRESYSELPGKHKTLPSSFENRMTYENFISGEDYLEVEDFFDDSADLVFIEKITKGY